MEATSANTLSSNPDLDLAQRHVYGDSTAFDEIYERFAGMIYNVSYRMAGKADVAEDLTQEVFIRIHRHLGRFNGRSTLKTWIYQVTLNHCRSKLSRRRWFTRPLFEEEPEEGIQLVEERRGPEEKVLADDASRLLAKALRQVKPVFREAVILRDLEDLSYEEIAEVLHVRIGTVRSRIARGREQLRKILERSQ